MQTVEAKSALPSPSGPTAPHDAPFSRRGDPCGIGTAGPEVVCRYTSLTHVVASGSRAPKPCSSLVYLIGSSDF